MFFARPTRPPKPAPPPPPAKIEHVIQRFPSGQVQFDGYQLGKVKVGVWREIDQSGNPISETPYVRGILHGKVIRYHTTCGSKADNPIPATRTHYRFAVQDGPHVAYACSGEKTVEGQHLDGQRHGVWRWYGRGKDGAVVASRRPTPARSATLFPRRPKAPRLLPRRYGRS